MAAFTGDLENLHIVDVIQLLHATRKSGTFSVRGTKGESKIIFSNGYIVAASHLDNRIRIGTVMVKMNAITSEDLEQALEIQRNAGTNRKPLIVMLMALGKLGQEEAFRCLKKLIEMTIVELIGWTRGAFTFDTDAISVSPGCNYIPGEMDQALSLDAQMVLMDALRIFDERERDRASGKDIESYEEFFSEALPQEASPESIRKMPALTAKDLGLDNLDALEKKVQKPFSVEELFNPLEMRRQRIREILPDFSGREQEAFVSFLEKSVARAHTDKGSRQQQQSAALILFSRDNLIKHSVVTIYNGEGVPVFATGEERELDHIIAECLSRKIVPILVYDSPETSGGGFSVSAIIKLRQHVKDKYPQVSEIQLASPFDHAFMIQSSKDGIKTVLPKPHKDAQRETFIEDSIQFLETLRSSIRNLLPEKTQLRKR